MAESVVGFTLTSPPEGGFELYWVDEVLLYECLMRTSERLDTSVCSMGQE